MLKDDSYRTLQDLAIAIFFGVGALDRFYRLVSRSSRHLLRRKPLVRGASAKTSSVSASDSDADSDSDSDSEA